LYEEKIKAYKHFANKLWNIARFTFEFAPTADATLQEEDKKILETFRVLATDVTKDIDEYRFYLAGEKLYHYVWHELADKLLEESKAILKGSDATASGSRSTLLNTILVDSLKLLHPFMPFITEEIWSSVPKKESDLLMVARWPAH
jgi:valyl-tRNA synthetase